MEKIRAAILLLLLPAAAGALTVDGRITQREEIWDRRGNPLMGRPDVLLEVRFTIAPGGGGPEVAASAKGKRLLALRGLVEGSTGIFQVSGGELLSAESVVSPPPTPRPAFRPTPQPAPELPFPENLRARDLKASPALQKKALRAVSKKYAMSAARILYLTSHRGPMPPDGGYLYWGVAGKVKGRWQVWQPGRGGRLHPGQQLIDPKRHQK